MRLNSIIWILFIILFGCSDDYSNLPQMSVDFNWPKDQKCFDERSPRITLENVPNSTKSFQINLYDLDSRYDHGGGTVTFEGLEILAEGSLKEYKGPCPGYGSPRYQLTVKAIDENGKVIAIGKQTKKFPPEPE
jgi:phosphatidylethanolamine-binding protein (PEBP) family uncharacterized protein